MFAPVKQFPVSSMQEICFMWTSSYIPAVVQLFYDELVPETARG